MLQGIVQAVSAMGERVGLAWVVAPFAFLLSLSIAGIGSAWLGGSARIPFVAGLDSYMPAWLGKVHPKYGTPYAALIVHAIVSVVLVVLNFVLVGSTVQESFQRLLSLSVVLQLIPFVYMFCALLRIAFREAFHQRALQPDNADSGRFQRVHYDACGDCGGVLSGTTDQVAAFL